eukprot:gene20018-26735_t
MNIRENNTLDGTRVVRKLSFKSCNTDDQEGGSDAGALGGINCFQESSAQQTDYAAVLHGFDKRTSMFGPQESQQRLSGTVITEKVDMLAERSNCKTGAEPSAHLDFMEAQNIPVFCFSPVKAPQTLKSENGTVNIRKKDNLEELKAPLPGGPFKPDPGAVGFEKRVDPQSTHPPQTPVQSGTWNAEGGSSESLMVQSPLFYQYPASMLVSPARSLGRSPACSPSVLAYAMFSGQTPTSMERGESSANTASCDEVQCQLRTFGWHTPVKKHALERFHHGDIVLQESQFNSQFKTAQSSVASNNTPATPDAAPRQLFSPFSDAGDDGADGEYRVAFTPKTMTPSGISSFPSPFTFSTAASNVGDIDFDHTTMTAVGGVSEKCETRLGDSDSQPPRWLDESPSLEHYSASHFWLSGNNSSVFAPEHDGLTSAAMIGQQLQMMSQGSMPLIDVVHQQLKGCMTTDSWEIAASTQGSKERISSPFDHAVGEASESTQSPSACPKPPSWKDLEESAAVLKSEASLCHMVPCSEVAVASDGTQLPAACPKPPSCKDQDESPTLQPFEASLCHMVPCSEVALASDGTQPPAACPKPPSCKDQEESPTLQPFEASLCHMVPCSEVAVASDGTQPPAACPKPPSCKDQEDYTTLQLFEASLVLHILKNNVKASALSPKDPWIKTFVGPRVYKPYLITRTLNPFGHIILAWIIKGKPALGSDTELKN